MGPIALYDKSFLEGLSLDEAVMFDVYFYPVTCPVFFVETLANLAKEKRGRTPEELVGAIAAKFPQMHGAPNVHHKTLALHNLYGGDVPMTGQIALAGGIAVNTDGKRNVVFDESPESVAFGRWQAGRFEDLERQFAQGWRQDLANLDLAVLAERGRRYGKSLASCKQIEDCNRVALELIDELPNRMQFDLACELLNLSVMERARARSAWEAAGQLSLKEFAPYAHYVLSIQIFFDIALATGKISSDRPSNFNDMAYLYYLPFSHAFVSNDKLHRVCAPLFMRSNQQFVWGEDLKADLRKHNEVLLALPESARDQGLISLSPKPLDGSLIRSITDRAILAGREDDGLFIRKGRQSKQEVDSGGMDAELNERIRNAVKDFHAARGSRWPMGQHEDRAAPNRPTPPLSSLESQTLQEHIQRIIDAAESGQGDMPFDPSEADSMAIKRMIQRKRGSWFQVPKGLKVEK